MHPIAQKLATLQRRITYRESATAACWTAATLLAAALALGLADYLARIRDPGLRIMATCAFAAAATFAAYRWWYRPGGKRFGPLSVARKVESHFPQLNDSLASAVEFLQQSEDDKTAGSAQLRRIVVAEAESATAGLPLDEVIDRRPLRRASTWLVAVCVVLGACLAWDASAVRTAFARLVAPLGNSQWPRHNHLEFRNPPTRLAAGQPFEAELIDTNGNLPDEVRVVYRLSAGARRETISESMTRIGDVMVARRENIRGPFAFRAAGGDDDMMQWHWVDVVEPPQLSSLAITIHPPAYTGLPQSPAERHLDVLAGTQIELHGTATEPLSSARILQDGEAASAAGAIDATISNDNAHNATLFHIPPGKWIATNSGPYRLQLSDSAGLAGVAGQWNLRVEPDSPPSVSWQSPGEDLYVVPSAVVPIELVVKDNLAIERVDLTYERSDWSEAERERLAPKARIEMYRGPEKPGSAAVPAANADSARGETRVVDYAWDLGPLDMTIGAEVSITAEAADYRPGLGRTAGPRRITIITPDELDARFAERLAQIGRQLERALAVERATREGVRRLEIGRGLAGHHRRDGRAESSEQNVPVPLATLQSAGLNQRRVERILIDPVEGVPALIEGLVRDLEINRVAQSDVRNAIDRLSAELERLASGPLAVADRELTTSRKTIDEAAQPDTGAAADNHPALPPEQEESFTRALTAAGAAQDDVIATLERLVSELSGNSDYRRFVRLVTELRADQLTHEQATRSAIGVSTLPLRVSDLTRAQQASLKAAAAGQNAIAARYENIEQGMDALSQELAQGDAEGADRLTDAVELARNLAIGAKMTESARDISENRVSGALDREVQIASDLQQVLDVLRGTTEGQPEQLADKLKEAEEQLDALRKQLAELRQEISKTEKLAGNARNQQQIDALNKKQQDLRREIGKLAQQLDRLQAADASESAQSAANRLDNQKLSDNQPPQQPQRPSSSNDVQRAEEDLAAAAEQLADRRQQAEDDLALQFIRALQTELTEMVERQKKVVDQTAALHNARPPNAPLPQAEVERATKLADEERALAQMAKDHSDFLHGLGAVRVSLEEAERRLLSAATLLDGRNTGPDAQQAERLALARLEGMMDTFSQTADEARPDQPPPNPGAGANAQQPQRRPTFELLEVKMLRMLQVDLQTRTRDYQQRLAALAGRGSPDPAPPNDNQRANLQKEAQELAAEQGRLAELVEDMLTRDNKEAEQ